jgi:membrane-bound serine protease (ClpP class)
MDWITVSLFLALGFILVLLELFVIPGFTFFGIAGLFIITGSIVYSFIELPLIQAFGMFVGAVVFTSLFLFVFFKSGAHKHLILNFKMPREKGFKAFQKNYEFLQEKTGKTATPLHPSGIIVVNGERYDAVSEGGFIQENLTVKVVKVEGHRIVVRELKENKL